MYSARLESCDTFSSISGVSPNSITTDPSSISTSTASGSSTTTVRSGAKDSSGVSRISLGSIGFSTAMFLPHSVRLMAL